MINWRGFKKMLPRILVLALLAANSLIANLNPEPIDYGTPKKYLTIEPSLGVLNAIKRLARKLKAETAAATIQNISRWMNTLICDDDFAYEWRNFDTVLEQKSYASCADYAITAGVLLKAADIPTIWVKSMDVEWIWDFKTGRKFSSWSGHVFLEIYIEDTWVLFDPTTQKIYKNYKPSMHILPGNRLAYHKGNDPKNMIMSLQWDEWKKQTIEYFELLDIGLLPVDQKAVEITSKQAYVLANSPGYIKIGEYVEKFGYRVTQSFNTDLDSYMPLAKGNFLFIETRNGKPIIEIKEVERFFPGASQGLKTLNSPILLGGTTIVFIDPAGI